MNILTDLKAALEARKDDGSYGDDEQPWYLTDDTIRALLDVAEALRDTCIMGAAEREDGLIIPPRQVQSIASKLAPLVKEADHDRA